MLWQKTRLSFLLGYQVDTKSKSNHKEDMSISFTFRVGTHKL
jgi:hypothetical protein